jgi:heptosyltransferase-1
MSFDGTSPADEPRQILVVRLGALGDIIHTLPAVVRLKCSFPRASITWAVEPRWAPLLVDNPYIDEVIPLPIPEWRKRVFSAATRREFADVRFRLRATGFDLAIDFQGLLKSALVTYFSRAERVFGFDRQSAREKLAASFYSDPVRMTVAHVVERNLVLAAAAGAKRGELDFPLPGGVPSDSLPSGDYVLASPVAGWKSKQWPAEHYLELADRLWSERQMPLVIDCGPGDREIAESLAAEAADGAIRIHISPLEGLIAATRRARAVVGVDSGPLHLAAALGIPGVAIYGPTDPARNGPYRSRVQVLRAAGAEITYKRADTIHPSMRAILPADVWGVLRPLLDEGHADRVRENSARIST